ncbi:MAG: hypothetical protein AAF741_12335 [Bacteroidota bacterium]
MVFLPFLVDWVAVNVILFLIVLPIVFLLFYIASYNKKVKDTQRRILDVEILEFIDGQIDGTVSTKMLRDKSGLTKYEASARLQNLATQGLLRMSYSAKMKAFYKLRKPFDKRDPPTLSEEPFLTVQDVLTLFKHFDFAPDLQDLVIATRLPVKVIMREMRYFQKEKIIQILYGSTDGMGTATGSKSFVLEEPYRSNPDKFLAKEERLNLELREVLVKDSLLV